ncbi:hypothetical protein KI387_027986, partial [Taxus chinensis]
MRGGEFYGSDKDVELFVEMDPTRRYGYYDVALGHGAIIWGPEIVPTEAPTCLHE